MPLLCNSINRVGSPNGVISAQVHNPAVSNTLLKEIWQWKTEGCSDVDVITRLRMRTVPLGYDVHTWVSGSSYAYLCDNHLQMSIILQDEMKLMLISYVLSSHNWSFVWS